MRLHKAIDSYGPEHERCIIWDDLAIEVRWRFDGPPILCEKDGQGAALLEAECVE